MLVSTGVGTSRQQTQQQTQQTQQQAQYAKLQTESRSDVLFIQSELKAAVRSCVAARAEQLAAVADARSRILEAKRPDLAGVAASAAGSDSDRKLLARSEPLGVQQEVERRLAKWIEHVNGIEYTKALEAVQEYEPFDEELRQEADSLHHSVQDALVATTRLRREVPQAVDVLAAESVRMLADITENAAVAEPPEMAMPAVPSLGMDQDLMDSVARDYADAVSTHRLVGQSIAPKLEKAKRAQAILDRLKVPSASLIRQDEQFQHAQSGSGLSASASNSSGGVGKMPQTPRSSRRQSSGVAMRAPPMTPRTAGFGLVRRLEAEARRNAAASSISSAVLPAPSTLTASSLSSSSSSSSLTSTSSSSAAAPHAASGSTGSTTPPSAAL
ncbi:hypothetical protein BC831DRAFT_466393 [Entophlyctis helioformis]|nr:hypothetical protein BC831DRAFT_466393 [Entophlyctis helioformis]